MRSREWGAVDKISALIRRGRWASQVVLVVKNLPANARDKKIRVNPWIGKISWRRAWQPTPVFLPGESPWTEEPGGLQSMGLHRVGHNWNDLACRMHEQTESLYICLLTAVALGSSWGQLLRSPVSLLLQGLTKMIELPSQAKHSGVWDWQWAIISELRGVRVANQQGASSSVLDRHCLALSG